MQSYDISGQTAGKIWHRNPTPSDNGIAFVFNQTGNGSKTVKRRRFLHASFLRHKDKILVADHVGGVFLFDFENNRYTNVQQCGQSCTAIATGLKRSSEYLVGLADSSVKCYTTDSKEMVSWMRGHDSAVHSISIHSSGKCGVTTSRHTAQLWDFDTFKRVRKLNVRTEVPITEVFFLPATNTILTCFVDDTIFGWEHETFEWKFKLTTHEQKQIGYKTFAVTRDGMMLVAGGNSQLVHLYSLTTNELVQMIKMPDEVKSVKQVHFLCDRFDSGNNKILGALCQDGVARYVDILTCQQIFELRSPDPHDRLSRVCASADNSSNFIVGITEAGAMIVYDVTVLMTDYDKPPGPVVRSVRRRKKLPGAVRSGDDDASDVTSDYVTQSSASDVSSGRLTVRRFKYNSLKGSVSANEGLQLPRLRNILRGAGAYPERHRFFIWRHLLKLPENQSAFTSLTDKGAHLAFAAVEEKFPIKSIRLSRVMQRILSAMAHWSKIFAEVEYLPLVVFPFVKLFQNNSLICFETIASFVVNWFQHWFEFFPNPPVNMLSLVENIIAHHDKDLLRHLVACDVTTQVYAWPLMQTVFSEVFSKNEWLRLFDHILTNHPGFFYHVIAAYSICCRSALMRTVDLKDFKYFYHHRNALDVGAVIAEAYRISMCTPKAADPMKLLDKFEPIACGETYPIFNKYPKFIVDYQSKERERIRKEELDYLRERQVTHQLAERMLSRKQQEDAWYQRKAILDDAEEERRKLLLEEERKLASQRKKLGAMKRELKTRELELLDKARMRFVDHQQAVRNVEIRRLEDEVRRKAFQRDEEKSSAIDDVDIRGLELEIQRAALEQQMAQEQAEHDLQLRDEIVKRRHAEDIEERDEIRLRDVADVDLEKVQSLERDLGSAELRLNAINHRNDIVARLMNYDVDREKNLARSLSKSINQHRQHVKAQDKLEEATIAKNVQAKKSGERVRFLDQVRADGDDRRNKLLEERDLEKCRQRVRESEQRLREQLEELGTSDNNAFDHNNDRSIPIYPNDDDDRTTAVHNLNAFKQIEKDENSTDVSTWTYDSSRMDLGDDKQEMMNRVRDLRRRLVTHRKPH